MDCPPRQTETAKHFKGFDLFLTDNSQIWVVICENPNFRKLKRKEDRVRKQISRNSYSLENKLSKFLGNILIRPFERSEHFQVCTPLYYFLQG